MRNFRNNLENMPRLKTGFDITHAQLSHNNQPVKQTNTIVKWSSSCDFVQSWALSVMEYTKFLKCIPNHDQVLDHLAFLRYIDDHPMYYNENVVKRAILR